MSLLGCVPGSFWTPRQYDLLRRVLEAPEPDYCAEIRRRDLSKEGRLSPLLWGLYIADLVSTLEFLPSFSSHVDQFVGILLFMNDFCLNSST